MNVMHVVKGEVKRTNSFMFLSNSKHDMLTETKCHGMILFKYNDKEKTRKKDLLFESNKNSLKNEQVDTCTSLLSLIILGWKIKNCLFLVVF